MKQVKSEILAISGKAQGKPFAGKKSELYCEDDNIFLMSHNSKWHKPEGLQPQKMHSWKCAAFICKAKQDHTSLSINDVCNTYNSEINEALSIWIDSVDLYEVKYTRKQEDVQPKQEDVQEEMHQMKPEMKQEDVQEEMHQMKPEMKQEDVQPKMQPEMKQMQQMQMNNKMQMMMQMMQQMMQPESSFNEEEMMKQMQQMQVQIELQAKAIEAYKSRIEALENNAPNLVEYSFTSFNGTHKVEGMKHKMFDKVAKAINMAIPCYLSGPAGSGKNVMCEMIAKAFGLDFYYSNAVTQEYKMTGHSDINGNLVETPFYKAFTQGGLFMLDEVDASDPNALIILNAALANSYFDFPVIGNVKMHENFRCIAAGNTKGTGATLQYSSRFIIDEATRDRFAFFEIDYDEAIEASIIKKYGADDEILPFVYDIRKSAKKNNITVIAGLRLINYLAKMTKAGFSTKDAVESTFANKYNIDDIRILAGDLMTYNNKYTEALKKIAA